MARLKTAILFSGRGSNMGALIDACAAPGFPAEIVLAIGNVAGAGGNAIAQAAGIPVETIAHRDYPNRKGFEHALHQMLLEAGVELVCLAGFMRLLTPEFVGRWHDRLVNIHPSLLPAYPGLHTHRRALEDGVRFSGCTVHFVRAEMDSGPIIIQAAVPICPGDDEETLARRVLAEEHRCYPLALRWIAEGRVRIDGAHVAIDGPNPPQGTLRNPDG